jgi:hypothetical protein
MYICALIYLQREQKPNRKCQMKNLEIIKSKSTRSSLVNYFTVAIEVIAIRFSYESVETYDEIKATLLANAEVGPCTSTDDVAYSVQSHWSSPNGKGSFIMGNLAVVLEDGTPCEYDGHDNLMAISQAEVDAMVPNVKARIEAREAEVKAEEARQAKIFELPTNTIGDLFPSLSA